MFSYRESHQDAQAAAALERIRARRAANLEAQQKQVEEWYRSSFRAKPELGALQELTRLLRGSGGRRRGGE